MHFIAALLCAACLLVETPFVQSKKKSALVECSSSGFTCTGGSRVQQCVDHVAQGPEFDCDYAFVCDAEAEPGPCVFAQKTCCAEGTFPVPGNCRRFTLCVSNGQRLLQYDGSCSPGYEFHPRKLKCLLKEIAGCSIIIPDESNSTTTTSSSSSSSPTTTTVITTETTPQITTTKPTTFSCTAPGQFTDPTSCRHYIVCTWVSGTQLKPTRTPCTTNLFYDTNLRQCVFNTNCGNRPK